MKSMTMILLTIFVTSECFSKNTVIELKTAEKSYTGLPIHHNKQVCWLAGEDGSYSGVLFRDVIGSRRLKRIWQPCTSLQVKSQLQKELGSSFEIKVSGQFVVAAPIGRAAQYAKVLERMSRHFYHYCSVRRLPLKFAGFPLVTIVYPNQLELAKAARAQGVSANLTLKGFYSPGTNRTLLFEEHSGKADNSNRLAFSSSKEISDQTLSTLVHEGIHQLAFNQGLHSRVGDTPRWIVEGLATVLEANANMNRTYQGSRNDINPERLIWFQRYASEKREETIADFIADDEKFFRANNLNAYSQAWALTYFLSVEYSSNYAAYLKILSEKDPLATSYSADARLADFQKAFGNDLNWLEVRFLRFIDELDSSVD